MEVRHECVFFVAGDDDIEVTNTETGTFDLLDNDASSAGGTLTITHINGQPVEAGDSVLLSSGETITLNADGTVDVQSDGELGENTFSYSVADEFGNTDAAFVTLSTVPCFVAGSKIATPDGETKIEDLIAKLEDGRNHNKTSSIVVVAEGNKSGNAIEVARQIDERFDYYDTRVVILGHVQRGGIPTCRDRVMASRLGHAAVETLLEGLANLAVGFDSDEIVHTSFAKATKLESDMDMSKMGLIDILSG